MSEPMDNFRTIFIERFKKSQESMRLVEDSMNLLQSINTENNTVNNTVDVINNFLPTLSDYNALTEDLTSVRNLLQEVIDNKRPLSSAIAFINYLYDVTYFKTSRLLMMQQVFKCYF